MFEWKLAYAPNYLCADIEENEQRFYLIEWEINGKKYKNHYCANPLGIYYGEYMFAMTKCGFDEFEGF